MASPYGNPYAQAMRYQDELEKRRQQLGGMGVMQQPRQTAQSMVPDEQLYADANQDLSGLEGKYKRQMAVADQMRGREIPQGKTVGPSGIYVENPYEQAGAAFSRLMGAKIARDAERGSGEELSTARQGKADAAARLARASAMQDAGRFDIGTGVDREKLDQDARQSRADLKLRRAKAAADADRAAAERKDNMKLAWERSDLLDPDTGRPGSYWERGDEISYGPPGAEGSRMLDGNEARQLFSYQPSTETGSMEALPGLTKDQERLITSEGARMSAQEKVESTTDMIGDVLNSDALDKYAGPLNLKTFAARHLGMGDDSWEATATSQRLAVARVAPLAAYSEIFRPFSNVEVELSMDTLPKLSDQPGSIVAYFSGPGKQALREQYNKGLANTQGRPEARAELIRLGDMVFNKLDRETAKAAVKQGFSPDQAETYGIDEDMYLEILRAEAARRSGM